MTKRNQHECAKKNESLNSTLEHENAHFIMLRNRLLDTLTVSSGAVDSISFLGLGKVFTALMTGNFVFLGMGIAGHHFKSILSILTSMVAFATGVYLGTRIAPPGNQKNGVIWSPQATLALGVSLLGHLCFVVVWVATSGQPGTGAVRFLLVAWALTMGVQSAAVRTLHVAGVYTTVATGTFIVLASNLANLRLTRGDCSQLPYILISLIIGATAGAYLLFHAPIFAPMLPFIITIGVVATAAIAFRHDDKACQSRRKVTAVVARRRRSPKQE